MDKCPCCQSNKLEIIGTSYLSRGFTKSEDNRITTGRDDFPQNEILCHECGYIHKEMPKAGLERYLQTKPYFN